MCTSNNSPATLPVNPNSRAKAARKARKSRKGADVYTPAMQAADSVLALAFAAYHTQRLALWAALAELAKRGWVIAFDTEAPDSTSARLENASYFGRFRFQPERKPSGRVAGVRNPSDYPAHLSEKTHGWREVLSPEAQALADRAHGYLELVSIGRPGTTTTAPLLAERGAIWRTAFAGMALYAEVVRIPELSVRNNGDLTGRIYARMREWRKVVSKVSPRAVPHTMRPPTGPLPVTVDLVACTASTGADPWPVTLNPLLAYLSGRTLFWSQVSRLETTYADRFLYRSGGKPLGTGRTLPDKAASAFHHAIAGVTRDAIPGVSAAEDVLTREDFIQGLTPYTYRAMASWHPAKGCFSTYFEFKVRHALRNVLASQLPRCDSFAQEQDFMTGTASPHSSRTSSWMREQKRTDLPAGVSDSLVRSLTTTPDMELYLHLQSAVRKGAERLAMPPTTSGSASWQADIEKDPETGEELPETAGKRVGKRADGHLAIREDAEHSVRTADLAAYLADGQPSTRPGVARRRRVLS